MNVLVTIPACSHQRPERHAHCKVWHDGVPVLHVEPVCTSLRQHRVVLQELEQDDVEVVAPRAKQKRKFGQKGRLNVRSTTQKRKNEICKSKKNPASVFFYHYGFS